MNKKFSTVMLTSLTVFMLTACSGAEEIIIDNTNPTVNIPVSPQTPDTNLTVEEKENLLEELFQKRTNALYAKSELTEAKDITTATTKEELKNIATALWPTLSDVYLLNGTDDDYITYGYIVRDLILAEQSGLKGGEPVVNIDMDYVRESESYDGFIEIFSEGILINYSNVEYQTVFIVDEATNKIDVTKNWKNGAASFDDVLNNLLDHIQKINNPNNTK